MKRVLFYVVVPWLFLLTGCKRGAQDVGYRDNTLGERFKFYDAYNETLLKKLKDQQVQLQEEIAALPEGEDRADKEKQLASLNYRLERPKFFEILTEEDLPEGLEWTTNLDEPELGSPEAKKGGTYHTYILGNSYPPTIRCLGREANNAFRSYHWDDIEMALTLFHPETGKVIPGLADRWSVAEDGQTVYFHIDDEAKWSDGREVTSGDFLMSMYVYLSDYLTENFYRNYFGEQFWGIATYGKDYLCVRLSNPKVMPAGFAGLLPFQEEFYKEFGPDFETRYQWRPRPTTGAYQILPEDIKKGRSISLTRVKDWWAKDRKYFRYRYNVDKIEYMLVRDEEKVFQMFLRGDIDGYLITDSKKWGEKSEVEPIFNGYIERAVFYNEYPTVSRGLYFNMSRPLLDVQDIRIGLQHATNFEKAIQIVFRGDAERLHLLNAGYGEFSHPTLRTRPFSIEKARESFSKAGFTKAGSDGILMNDKGERLSFTITYPKHPVIDPVVLVLKEEAKRAGVEYRIEAMDPTASFQKVSRKEHQIALVGYQSQPPIPDYYQSFHSKDAYEPGTKTPRPMTNNICVFADPAVDPILEENRNARSVDVVRETSYKLEEIFHERAVWCPAYYRPFYRVGYWRWVKWPEGFNVRLANEPEMSHVHWIDPEVKAETLKAKREGRSFPEVLKVYDQHRKAPVKKEDS